MIGEGGRALREKDRRRGSRMGGNRLGEEYLGKKIKRTEPKFNMGARSQRSSLLLASFWCITGKEFTRENFGGGNN